MDCEIFLNYDYAHRYVLDQIILNLAVDGYNLAHNTEHHDAKLVKKLRKAYSAVTNKRLSSFFWLDEIILLQLKFHGLKKNVILHHDIISFNRRLETLNAISAENGTGTASKIDVLGLYCFCFSELNDKIEGLVPKSNKVFSPWQEASEGKKLLKELLFNNGDVIRMGNVKNIVESLNLTEKTRFSGDEEIFDLNQAVGVLESYVNSMRIKNARLGTQQDISDTAVSQVLKLD